jgi:hypothetical protein
VFPLYDDVLAGVPEYERYLTLGQLEASTDRLAARPGLQACQAGVSRSIMDGAPALRVAVP